MKQTKFRTVQSLLVWLEEQTRKKIYIKVYSNGSGEIREDKTEKSLFEFDDPVDLANLLDKIVDRYKLEEND